MSVRSYGDQPPLKPGYPLALLDGGAEVLQHSARRLNFVRNQVRVLNNMIGDVSCCFKLTCWHAAGAVKVQERVVQITWNGKTRMTCVGLAEEILVQCRKLQIPARGRDLAIAIEAQGDDVFELDCSQESVEASWSGACSALAAMMGNDGAKLFTIVDNRAGKKVVLPPLLWPPSDVLDVQRFFIRDRINLGLISGVLRDWGLDEDVGGIINTFLSKYVTFYSWCGAFVDSLC